MGVIVNLQFCKIKSGKSKHDTEFKKKPYTLVQLRRVVDYSASGSKRVLQMDNRMFKKVFLKLFTLIHAVIIRETETKGEIHANNLQTSLVKSK